jgi:hypothetical protein
MVIPLETGLIWQHAAVVLQQRQLGQEQSIHSCSSSSDLYCRQQSKSGPPQVLQA